MPLLNFPAIQLDIHAIVFDKDGVLQDFKQFWGAVTRARVLGLGLDPERHTAQVCELEALLGYPDDSVDADGPLVLATRGESAVLATGYLYRHLGMPWVEARSRVEKAFDLAYGQVPEEALRACEGTVDAIRAMKAMGWKMAVATTDNKDHALQALTRLGIVNCFEAIVGGDEVSRGKPDPEMYYRACQLVGVLPDETVIVGDGVNDLRMGRAAGCRATIGVLSGVSRREQLESDADLILDGVRQLPALCV